MKDIVTFTAKGTAGTPMKYKDFDATCLRVRTEYNGQAQEYEVTAWGQNQDILRRVCAGQQVCVEGVIRARQTNSGTFYDLRATSVYVAPEWDAEEPQGRAQASRGTKPQTRRETRAQGAQARFTHPTHRGSGYEEAEEDLPF